MDSHQPDHDNHDHSHHDLNSPSKSLLWAFSLTFSFMFAEWIGGVISGSLALIADAGHMLTDSSALLLGLVAMWFAKRPAGKNFSYGWQKAEVLGAIFNGLLLVVLALWISLEAWERYGQVYEIQTEVMLSVALLGLIVNFISFKILHKNHTHSVNIRSAMFHVIGDILGSVGALVAGVVIHFTGYNAIDLWISGFITLLILFGATKILSDSIKIILDAYPQAVNPAKLQSFLLGYPGVMEICDLHVWGINSKDSILTAHLVVTADNQKPQFVTELAQELQKDFGIDHITIQLEENACGLTH